MNESNEYKYSGNFLINGNTRLANPMFGNNKRELFRRLRATAERELAKGYRLYVKIIDNETLDVAEEKHYQF